MSAFARVAGDPNMVHYSVFSVRDEWGMDALRRFFPEGKADEMNVCLFSTSGVHGTYGTIEDAEADIARGFKHEDGGEAIPQVTYLIVQPRIVALRYGNCLPQNQDDINWLKELRASSWKELAEIGAP